MTADETPDEAPLVRLRVELVVEIADAEALTGAALERIETDELMPDAERAHARRVVAEDSGEAIAYLVDPVDLVGALPGVELAHASWGSEEVDADDLGEYGAGGPGAHDEDDEDDGDDWIGGGNG